MFIVKPKSKPQVPKSLQCSSSPNSKSFPLLWLTVTFSKLKLLNAHFLNLCNHVICFILSLYWTNMFVVLLISSLDPKSVFTKIQGLTLSTVFYSSCSCWKFYDGEENLIRQLSTTLISPEVLCILSFKAWKLFFI